VLVELGGLPIIYSLLESTDPDARRDAIGLLFGLGYRKDMPLAELLAKNDHESSWSPETMAVARSAMDACFDEASYEYGKKVAEIGPHRTVFPYSIQPHSRVSPTKIPTQ